MQIDKNKKCDVIVVGAGPAGIAAAITLAKGGKKVVLVERGGYPGSKNMFGGSIFVEPTLEIFPNLIEDAPIERFNIAHNWMLLDEERSLNIGFQNHSPKYNSATVVRAKFDRWCAEEAKKRGVVIAYETLVEELIVENKAVIGIRTELEEYYADIVILADGVNSLLAEQIGLRKELKAKNLALSVKEVFKLPKELINERFNVKETEGKAYQFIGGPMEKMFGMGFLYLNKNSVSIGLGVSLEDLKRKKLRIYELLDELKSHKSIAPMIEGGELLEYSAHMIPEGGYDAVPKLYADGVMIIGDAASLINNVHFEGTNLAMISGKIAAETALQAIEQGDFTSKTLFEYEQRLKDSFILKDLKSYQNVLNLVNDNSDVFLGIYIKKICEFFDMFTKADSTPKKVKYRNFIAKFFKERGILGLIKDFWAFIRMGIGVIK